MRLGKEHPVLDQNYVWRRGCSSATCSGSIYQIIMRFGWNTLGVSRKVVLEAHDIPRRGSGDPLMDRSGRMIDFLIFIIRGRQTRPRGPFRSKIAVLTHNVGKASDSQSSPASLKKLKLRE